jgi:hypothetical protein
VDGHKLVRAAARRASDRPVVTGVAAALAGGAIVAVLAFVSPHGVGGLVHAAPPYTDASAPASLPVLAPDRAFDGQYFYRVAVAPFATGARVAGVQFDVPALRHQRLGYPVLAWIAAGGDRDRVPGALVATNVAAMFALGLAGGALARASGRHAAWGLLLPCYPGFVYSLGFDLAEITAAAFVAGAIVALGRGRAEIGALLASAAVLTRETAAILPFALLVAAIATRRARDPGARAAAARLAVAGVVPLAVAGAWQVWIRAAWGEFGLTASAGKNVRFPFQGLLDASDRFWPPTSGAAVFRVVSLAFLALVVAAAAAALPRSAAPLYAKAGFVLGALVLPLLSEFPWSGATSFVRAATEAYVFGVVVLFGHPGNAPVRALTAASSAGLFGLTFVSEVGKAR